MHFALEGPFLYLSTFGRTINTSTSFFTVLCMFSHNLRPTHPFFQSILLTPVTLRERLHLRRRTLWRCRSWNRIPGNTERAVRGSALFLYHQTDG